MQEISSDDDVGQQSVWRPGQAASSGDKREIAPPDSPLHEELKVVIPAPETPLDGNLHEELKEGIPAPETPSEAFAPAPLAKRSRAFVPAKPTSKRLPQDMRLRKKKCVWMAGSTSLRSKRGISAGTTYVQAYVVADAAAGHACRALSLVQDMWHNS